MEIEKNEETQVEDTSGNPAEEPITADAPTGEAEGKGSDDGAKKENGDKEGEDNIEIPEELKGRLEEVKKEFQRDYTEKTMKLADERKAFESEREKMLSKASTLDKLVSNPKFQAWYNAEVEKEKSGDTRESKSNIPELTDEILADPAALAKYMEARDNAIRREYDEKFSKIEQESSVRQLTSDISEYGNEAGNEDFWKLRDAGLIRDEDVVITAQANPNASNLEILKDVHAKARERYNRIVEDATTKYRQKETEEIEKKKKASIDSGRSSMSSHSAPSKASFEDIMKEEAKKLGIPW